jgi:mRNA-degrading endonuclease RelE of RelBE toxin-antitoxin system
MVDTSTDIMAGKLNITYSAYRELELIPQSPLRAIGEAIIQLADDPFPPGSSALQGVGGCHYLAIDDYYILYYMDDEEGLTVLGVLQGPYHPLH